jgi:CBS domain-containing protein
MDPNPTVLKPTDTIKTAAKYIMEHRYRSLPVVDEEGHYLGIFDVNCLLKLVLPKAAVMEPGLDNVGFIQDTLQDLHKRMIEMEGNPISVCMTTDMTTVTPNTPLVETLLLLYRTRASIPVVSPGTGKLMGMISYFDVGEKVLSA